MRCVGTVAVLLVAFAGVCVAVEATTSASKEPFAAPGYELLTNKAYLPPDFDQATFDELWQAWEEPLRSKAAAATPDERRAMAFARYGFTPDPHGTARPQQYVVDAQGNWTMSCLACHQGQVAGRAIPGVPNSLLALQTLTDDVWATKLRLGKQLTRMELGSTLIPLGTTNGTTNAVAFGVVLMANRDADLNVLPPKIPLFTNHDHDAPAWWNFKKKTHLYSDGFAKKGVRPLMQFMLVAENGPERFHEWEADYQKVYDWLESLEPPAWPYEVDRPLAATGRVAFEAHCARCHGTYGDDPTYPELVVSIDEVGTDPIRLRALTPEHRRRYGQSWFTNFGAAAAVESPVGYLAPPLDGVWASAPYFHNGSVPTLWHVLHPDERPAVWTRTATGYDQELVGVEAQAHERAPGRSASAAERRTYFDTRRPGKSAAGHRFPDELSESEKRAVLEYLKTL